MMLDIEVGRRWVEITADNILYSNFFAQWSNQFLAYLAIGSDEGNSH